MISFNCSKGEKLVYTHLVGTEGIGLEKGYKNYEVY
jgi:hypothetical protein